MQTSKAAEFWLEYHRSNSKKNTVKAYEDGLTAFCQEFKDKGLEEVTSDEVLSFPLQLL